MNTGLIFSVLVAGFGFQAEDAAVPAQLTAYEVARAHNYIRRYLSQGSPLSVIASEIRTLRGQRGSTITVYCATVQTRAEGRVEQMRFYRVIDVAPAANLLSDYERGASDLISEEEGTSAEETKLCRGPLQDHDDIGMLRSSSHRSSGTSFRPFINDTGQADRQWLVGVWAFRSECASDNGMHLNSDGSYLGYAEAGRWSLDGDLLTIQVEEEESDDGEERRRVSPPKLSLLRITRAGIDEMSVRYPDATSGELTRC